MPEPLCNKAQTTSHHWASIIFLYTSQVQAQHRAVTVTAGGGGGIVRGGWTHNDYPPSPTPSFKPQLVVAYKQRKQQNPQTHQQVAP